MTDIEDDLTVTVDISSYLPEGTALVLASDAKVEVTAKVELLASKTFEVPVKNFTVTNLREGYLLEFDEDTIEVRISGPDSVVSELKVKDITGTLDAGGIGVGRHQLTVKIDLADYCRTEEKVKTPVIISADESVSEQPENSQTEADDAEAAEADDTAATMAPSANEGEPDSAENTEAADASKKEEQTH